MTPLMQTRLEKAALDCGFDRAPELDDSGLLLRSAMFPETVSVSVAGDGRLLVRSSNPVLLAPFDGEGGCSVAGLGELYAVLQKASATARTMPNRVVEKFRSMAPGLPSATEVERWAVQRVGQNLFRAALIDYWHGKCCVTGLAVPELLRASHIKPWAQCSSDEERLDVFNGLLLAPHLDALFDTGWITFDRAGVVAISERLPAAAAQLLVMTTDMHVDSMTPAHQEYLKFHRDVIFKG